MIGFVDGIAKLPLNLPLLKECSVVGTLWGEFTKRLGGAEEMPAGADLGNRRAIGKLVVTVDPTLA